MTILNTLILILTVFASVSIVGIVILLGWILIWKAFLSKFRLVRELLGQGNGQDPLNSQNQPEQHHSKVKKVRKE